MQYKTTKKILIDKRKLDILLRLNCPQDVLYNAIIYNNIQKTGDDLIDDNLEALIDVKEFHNWGGKREGSGRKNQLEKQLEKQNINQVVDKDKDIDIDIDNTYNKQINTSNINKEINFKNYGEYLNVSLTDEQYNKLAVMCASKKMLEQIIEAFSSAIETGKEKPYIADLPNAHYERLKSYYNYRKRNPNFFIQENKEDVWEKIAERMKDCKV